MSERTFAIDVAKEVFQVTVFGTRGQVEKRKRLSRAKLTAYMAQQAPSRVVMESCGGAHHWARTMQSLGHRVFLIPPQYVKPYRIGQKNDGNDADAIGVSSMVSTMRFVGVKSIEQQELQAVHRWRERIKTNRLQVVNQMRGLLTEFGIVMGKSLATFRRRIPEIVEDGENALTPRMRAMALEAYEELCRYDARLVELDREIEQLSRQDKRAKRLCQELSGVGPLSATALLCAVADPKAFKRGRQFAGYLGLVPRQYSTGDRIIHLGIKKGGQSYLRQLLIHGARSVIRHLGDKQDAQSRWLRELIARRGKNKAAVALANKNARHAWAILAQMA